jgi:hypothetical protein
LQKRQNSIEIQKNELVVFEAGVPLKLGLRIRIIEWLYGKDTLIALNDGNAIPEIERKRRIRFGALVNPETQEDRKASAYQNS